MVYHSQCPSKMASPIFEETPATRLPPTLRLINAFSGDLFETNLPFSIYIYIYTLFLIHIIPNYLPLSLISASLHHDSHPETRSGSCLQLAAASSQRGKWRLAASERIQPIWRLGPSETLSPGLEMEGFIWFHGSLNVSIEHHPTIRYMVYNGYYKVMSNIPKMGQLPTPGFYGENMGIYGDTLWLCQNSYGKWPSRNSELSHEKW